MNRVIPMVLFLVTTLLLSGCRPQTSLEARAPQVLRLGYFANLTHAQAILGVADGSLEQSAGVKIQAKVFNSGPAAITALFAGDLDLLYVGPSPAVAGYIRSNGRALRLIAGSASGGAVFVVRSGFDPTHLDGAHLATPGLGNTQDVALRHYLAQSGRKPKEQGGTVRITPMSPADMVSLFARGQIDGAWVPEPWGSRIIQETDARAAWDERDLWPDGRFATTVLAVAPEFLRKHPAVVRGFLTGHVALTRWIQSHPAEAGVRLQQALTKLQGKPLPDKVLQAAWQRLEFVTDPMVQSVEQQAEHAFRLGLLGDQTPDLRNLYDLSLLQEVRR